MIAGMLLLNQVLQKEEKPHKEIKQNNNNNIIDNAYFTEIRDIKGNLKGVKMIDYDSIEINGKKIKAYKSTKSIWNGFDRENTHIVGGKIIYELPIILYEKIPRIVNINGKRFYKTDINEINQTDFKLIEM